MQSSFILISSSEFFERYEKILIDHYEFTINLDSYGKIVFVNNIKDAKFRIRTISGKELFSPECIVVIDDAKKEKLPILK